MKERRQLLKIFLGVLVGAGVLTTPFRSIFRPLRAEERKIILPRGERGGDLVNRNPANLDTRNLDITPLQDFRTMGTTDYKVDLEKWRLEVTGRVEKALTLTYSQVLALPSTEKRVLLICPGFFANYGLWKGVLMEELLKRSGAENGAIHLEFTSPEGGYGRREKFSMKETLAGKVFLAYEVNGQTLPEKHGFPLRVVAEGHYGSSWMKYVSGVNVE